MAEAYNPDSVDGSYEDDEEEEVTVAEWNWGKNTVMNPWGRGIEESYDSDVTKSDKLFDFLLEKGQIKLLDNHVMLLSQNRPIYKNTSTIAIRTRSHRHT